MPDLRAFDVDLFQGGKTNIGWILILAIVPDTSFLWSVGENSDWRKGMRDSLRSRSSTVKTTTAVSARIYIVVIVVIAAFFLHLVGTGQVWISDGFHKVIGEFADVTAACSGCIGWRGVKWQIRSSGRLIRKLGFVGIKTCGIVGEEELLVVT